MQLKTENQEKVFTFAQIQNWLVAYIAEIMEVAQDEIDVKVPFDEYGLDSSMAVAMVADLETWLGRTLDPTLIYDYPTLEKLARYTSQI